MADPIEIEHKIPKASDPNPWDRLEEVFTGGIDKINVRIDGLEAKVESLKRTVTETTEEGKPSITTQIIVLKYDIAQLKGNFAKLWTLFAVPPITVLIGYAMLQMFGNHGGGK